jgi:acyl-CoA synthetase (NDP forming)
MAGVERLLHPKTIAVVGGGPWCAAVIRECVKIGFEGDIWPVHPKRDSVEGITAYPSVEALPGAPDACFIGVNREATIDVLSALNAKGAGGAVCFASGFKEAQAELADGEELQEKLLQAAGDMPILGPNCYGLINALDGAALWPDIHGCIRVESGVAILTQSSNIALNLTMQTRGLPMAYVGTVGNQARIDLAQLGQAVLEDPRVTALGLYIEGISDIRAFEALGARARALGKRIVALKVGASDQAQAATVSHTASLAGSDAGARALLARCGIAQVPSLEGMLDALKILHVSGPLRGTQIASMSCSGGEASLMADSVLGTPVSFPPLGDAQKQALRTALGPKGALANPLDYHTYIWGDGEALKACYSAMMLGGDLDLGCIVLDYPRLDRCDTAAWDIVVDAVAEVAKASGKPMALLSSLAETLPETVAQRCVALGIIPLSGVSAALEGIAAAAFDVGDHAPIWQPGQGGDRLVPEGAAKSALAKYGSRVPGLARAATPDEAATVAAQIGGTLVLKGEGLAHKSEAGAVRLNLFPDDVTAAAQAMQAPSYLVEEMISGTVAELLVGITRDPAHGYVLTLGAGGVMTEVLRDTVSLLLPVTREDVAGALQQLRMSPVLNGYRGAAGADLNAIEEAVLALQSFVGAMEGRVDEVEINPLICTEDKAVAADALLRGDFAEGVPPREE